MRSNSAIASHTAFKMREDIPSETRACLYRHCDPKRTLGAENKLNNNVLKPKSTSTWGAQIMKGFTTDKKLRTQPLIPCRKLPLTGSFISSQKTSRIKRCLVRDFPSGSCTAQVHPHVTDGLRTKDLLEELQQLRNLLDESKKRELKLQDEVTECKENSRISGLENELNLVKTENDSLIMRTKSLEAERVKLNEKITTLCSLILHHDSQNRAYFLKNWEKEVFELHHMNKELQLNKTEHTCNLSGAESEPISHGKISENGDVLAKVEAEASLLRSKNENLCKQVEGLQMSRLTEVEELIYLRWANSYLRSQLQSSERDPRCHPIDQIVNLSPKSHDKNGRAIYERNPFVVFSHLDSDELESRPLEGNSISKAQFAFQNDELSQGVQFKSVADEDLVQGSSRRHSISGLNSCPETIGQNWRRHSHSSMCPNETGRDENLSTMKERDQLKMQMDEQQNPGYMPSRQGTSKLTSMEIEKRASRIPNPPPKPSISVCDVPREEIKMHNRPYPPPPPPPPLSKLSTRSNNVMQRVPQVVEFYHSLTKRDSRRDSSVGGLCDTSNAANIRSSMIDEIENRSSYLLAIKEDVEAQGDFVNSLIKEVNDAVYKDIEDVVAFVKWLDDELCFLVDERAVLKHFDWPEKKADTLREAAFSYRDLKMLEHEVLHYEDDPRFPTDVALKKMVALSERMEQRVYGIFRSRDVLTRHCKEFQVPTDWMLDTGIISKIKFASVKLAMKYMKRVAGELKSMEPPDKDPSLEYMLLQGVRFAFRIHQFAGGFDVETMQAFEELRDLAHKSNRIRDLAHKSNRI